MMVTPPLRKQYLEIKGRYRDALLLFRIGDFYEAFDDDARVLARELDIVLTTKPMGKHLRVPLAGIPHQSLDRYLAILIARGYRVAICEQLEEAPAKGKRLIARDVVRVVTPGTVIEPGLLQSKTNNYLAAYVTDGRRVGLAHADVSTGDFAATEVDVAEALGELQRIAPAETLVARDQPIDQSQVPGFITRIGEELFEEERARQALLEHFGARTLAPFGLEAQPLAVRAAGAIIAYLREMRSIAIGHLTRLRSYETESFMTLDQQTVRALEIFESDAPAGTLLAALDRTRTPMGGRLLRRWLRQPLLDLAEIVRRQEHVRWFYERREAREEIVSALGGVHDLERLSARARSASVTPIELLSLAQSLEAIPRVRAVLQRDRRHLGALLAALPDCQRVIDAIRATISDEILQAGRGPIIRDGVSEELDRLRTLLRDGRRYLSELEERERARTGIKSLRVGYNKVFGYYIEVTRPNLHLVPEDYARKQTLVNAERFITLELKEHETLVVRAEERIRELEESLFRRLCGEIAQRRDEILAAARTLAYLDVIVSLAEVAVEWGYTCPRVNESASLRIRGGRHPVLERRLGRERFVANDLHLGGDGPRIVLLTGPNMSGKTTYMRQAALIVLLAQIGSFVPAAEAEIGLCDRIFTRAGLYDRIGSGESTFMTEMIETAHILHHASSRSLVLFDELGRGTSTYDGLSVARAVLEYIHNHPQLGCRTLFATHYHELTELESVLPRLENFHVEIAEREGELIFLYRVIPGRAERSYGVYAAKLAGLPPPIVRRARELLGEYEDGAHKARAVDARRTDGAELVNRLLDLDLNSLSPVEALMKLYELQREAMLEAGKGRRAAK